MQTSRCLVGLCEVIYHISLLYNGAAERWDLNNSTLEESNYLLHTVGISLEVYTTQLIKVYLIFFVIDWNLLDRLAFHRLLFPNVWLLNVKISCPVEWIVMFQVKSVVPQSCFTCVLTGTICPLTSVDIRWLTSCFLQLETCFDMLI